MATQDVETRQVDIVGEDWHSIGDTGEPAFQSSWVNYGSGWAPAGFRKDPSGLVMLRGLIKSGTINGIAFYLPKGYRPMNIAHTIVRSATETGGSRVKIYPDGRVYPAAGSNTWFDLGGVTFYAET